MKRALTVLIALLLLTGCVRSLADSDAQHYAIKPLQTFDSRVKLRDKPSRGGSILGQYYAGTPVTILSESDGWAEVRIGSQTGYMMREFLHPVCDPTPTLGTLRFPEADGRVTFTDLNGSELPRLEPGNVTVLGTVGDHLLHIATEAKGRIMDGLVASWHVSWTENFSTLTVTADAPSQLINLREAPSMDAPVLARMFPGARGYRLFDSHTAEDGWTWISFDGTAGYIRDDFLTSGHPAAYIPPRGLLKHDAAIVTGCMLWGSIRREDPLCILGIAGSKRMPLYLCLVLGWNEQCGFSCSSCFLQQCEVEPVVHESISTAGYTTRNIALHQRSAKRGAIEPEPSVSLPAGTEVTILGGYNAKGDASSSAVSFYTSYLTAFDEYLAVEVSGGDYDGAMGYLPIDAVCFNQRLILSQDMWANG